jgi:hypothetical protein
MAVLAGLGVGAAIWYSEGGADGSEAYALRVNNGVTETGEIVTLTTPSGDVRRVIKWRTRTGAEFTDTVVEGTTVFGPGDTVELPGGTKTVLGPGETLTLTETFTQPVTEIQTETHENTVTAVVTQTVTETIRDTVTVTQTIVNTVTETVVVTETVPAPTP